MSGNRVINLETPVELVAESSLFQTSTPNMVAFEPRDEIKSDSIKESIKSIEDMTDKSDQEEGNSRKDQNIMLYLLNLAVTFAISFQNIILVFTSDEQSKGYMSIAIVLTTMSVSLLSTYHLCRNKWKIFNLYILLDNVFLTEVASCFGFIGFLLVIYSGNPYETITIICFPLEILFFVGNFRILMLHVKWPKWRVILFKLVLLADSAVIFEIGAYYMSVDYLYTKGEDPQLDGQIKDFVLLYIFGLFALFVELYTKVCDIDQTSELKFEYQFKEMEEEKQIERIRKSVVGINKQVQKAHEIFLNQMKKRELLNVQEVQIF